MIPCVPPPHHDHQSPPPHTPPIITTAAMTTTNPSPTAPKGKGPPTVTFELSVIAPWRAFALGKISVPSLKEFNLTSIRDLLLCSPCHAGNTENCICPQGLSYIRHGGITVDEHGALQFYDENGYEELRDLIVSKGWKVKKIMFAVGKVDFLKKANEQPDPMWWLPLTHGRGDGKLFSGARLVMRSKDEMEGEERLRDEKEEMEEAAKKQVASDSDDDDGHEDHIVEMKER
ncbi:hypothetical protein FN846DRAFT_380673 [Sphaerosporella brunnea]|uniref:Uncharacterized protein n=1 Tax=Sphaerosporella brunnea TaxID=1250544 RepID=A0A5J5F5E1_9PEZI|nr:hypothetical protein FN846DRAFT_380673 [Sphaerosporella brunnea]